MGRPAAERSIPQPPAAPAEPLSRAGLPGPPLAACNAAPVPAGIAGQGGGAARPVVYNAPLSDAAVLAIPAVAAGQAKAPPETIAAPSHPAPTAAPAAAAPQPLEIPRAIPGSAAPPIRLPPVEPGESEAQRHTAIRQLFAELAQIEPVAGPPPTPDHPPLALQELQCLAITRSPLIRQAAADADAARGAMIQAGAYPNPHLAYEADNINTGRTAGYQGGNIGQTIVTGGKLKLAKAAAGVDLENAELALRRARFDLATQVRANYFAVLVALERVKVNSALVQFADRVYHLQVTRVQAGQAAPYEPLQLRVLAVQAQGQLLQTNHEYEAAWRRLAATLNCPGMPPAALVGQADAPLPQITYDAACQRILAVHTDLVAAQNAVAKARYQLRLARIIPRVPNLDTSTVIEHDFTTPPFGTTINLQIGAPIPVFDTNRGNIIAAEAALVRAGSEYDRTRNELLASLADIFARYQTAATTFQLYRGGILADQVRAYRGVYRRYQVDPDADFNDVLTAQQTLAGTISTYVQLLGDQWQAAVDLAGLLQIDDLFQMGQAAAEPVFPSPPLPGPARQPVEPLKRDPQGR